MYKKIISKIKQLFDYLIVIKLIQTNISFINLEKLHYGDMSSKKASISKQQNEIQANEGGQNYVQNEQTQPLELSKLEQDLKQMAFNRSDVSQTNRQNENFVQISKRYNFNNNKSGLDLQLQQLETKLFHQMILKSQNLSQNDLQREILKKLSEQIKQNLEENINDIRKTQQKLNNPLLNNYQKQQIRQNILQIRMTELANVRVLVNTYRHHEYRLALALFHIARIYQQLKCYQQAISHYETALLINQKYKAENKDAACFHSYLLTFLAQSQFALQSPKISLELLNQALEIQDQLKAQNYDIHEFYTLNTISNVFISINNQSEAISMVKIAIQSAETKYGKSSFQYALGFKTLAQVYLNSEKFNQGIQSIKQGINTLQVGVPQKQQIIIQFYNKLVEISLAKLNTLQQEEKKNYINQYIELLKKKYEIIQNTYGYRDKRAIKEKRHLASSLLKYYRISQAEEELQDILEIQEVVYGQKSVQVAKTLKLLGTVAMSQHQIKKAQKYLKKSQGIFHDQGQANLQKQVHAKLLVLAGNAKFLLTNKN